MVDYNRNNSTGSNLSDFIELNESTINNSGVNANSAENNAQLESTSEDYNYIDPLTGSKKKLDWADKLIQAPANLAMSALMNTADYVESGILGATELVARGIGRATGWEAAKNFMPYSHKQETDDHLTGRKMSEFWFGDKTSAYKANEGLYDFAGDLYAAGTIINYGLKGLQVGSKAAELATKAGVPAKWIDRIFVDSAAASKELKTIGDTVNGVARYGVTPSSVLNSKAIIGGSLKKIAPELAKEAIYSDAILYASGYQHDKFYPDGFTSAVKYAPISLAVGLGLPAISHSFKAAKLFNRGAVEANNTLAQALNEQMIKQGLDGDWLKDYNNNNHDLLNGFGLASNSEADVITANTYIVKSLEAVRDAAVAAAEKTGSPMISEIRNGYDQAILQARGSTNSAISSLVATVGKADAEFAKQAINNATKRYSNVMQGTTGIEIGPNRQQGLDSLTNAKRNKMKKLSNQANSADDILSHQALEELKELTDEGYQLIDQDGFVYDCSDYHIRWRDDPANLKNVKHSSKEIGIYKNHKNKVGITQAEVSAKDFTGLYNLSDPNRIYKLEAHYDGHVYDRISKTNKGLGPTDSAAYDTAWYLLGKEFDSLFSKVKTPDGKDELLWQALASNGYRRPLDLTNANHQQLAYLHKLSKTIGDSNLARLFDFGKSLDKYDNLSLSDALQTMRYEKTKQFMIERRAAGMKNKDYRLDRFSEDSLMEELTGFTTRNPADSVYNNEVGADYWLTDSVTDLQKRFVDSDPLMRKSRQYLLQKTNQLQALDDVINNETMQRLAENQTTRMQILEGSLGGGSADTLVSKVTNIATSRPHYSSGNMLSPNAIAYGTDTGLVLGSKILTQDFRRQTNTILNTSIGFNHEVSPMVTKEINNMLGGVVEKSKALLGDSESTKQLALFNFQSQSGYKIADDGLVQLGPNRWAFELSESEVNANVAEWATKHTGVDNTASLSDGLVPNPLTGAPLEVNDKVADLIREQHELNLLMHQGDTQLASAAGRSEPAFRNYHMPARNAQGKEVRVICSTDEHGSLTPEMYIFGSTAKQADAMAKLELTKSGLDKNPNYVIKSSEDIHMSLDLIHADIDKNFMRFADYTDVVQQEISKGGQASGVRTSVGNIIFDGDGLLKEIIESNNRNLQRQAARTRKMVFYDQVEKAKLMLANKKPGSPGYNELNEYLASLTGSTFRPDDRLGNLYKAFDEIIDLGGDAISDYKSLPEIAKAQQLAELGGNLTRQTSKFFKSTDEIKMLNNLPMTTPSESLEEATRLLKLNPPLKAKSIMGNLNRVATDGALMLGNLGYALMNLVSIPVVAPMVRSSMRKQATETALEYASRTGAWTKQLKTGDDIAIDLMGGLTETVNKFMNNKRLDRSVVSEAMENGWFSSNATLINEVFTRPADALLGKTGNLVMKKLKFLGEKSEELSRIWTFKMGYNVAEKAGLDHASSMSFAKKFMDNCIGNYASSNRPEIFQGCIGGLFGLFYTYNHNIIQQYLGNFLRGDKLSLATGAAMQSLMFGTKSIPGSDSIEKILLPLGEGKDYYTALRESGFDDNQARGIMYGGLSALTGLDFSAKGTINSVAIPGTTKPPALSMAGDIIDGVKEIANQIAMTEGLSPDTVWEILQTRLPVPLAKSTLSLISGYKVDRNGNFVVSPDLIGNKLWWASNLLSMKSVDERMNSEFNQRVKGYNEYRSEKSRLNKNNVAAKLRSAKSDEDVVNALAGGALNNIANGGSPSQTSSFLKGAVAKAYSTKAEESARELANTKTPNEAKGNLLNSALLRNAARAASVAQPKISGGNINPTLGQAQEFPPSEVPPVSAATRIEQSQPKKLFDNDSYARF